MKNKLPILEIFLEALSYPIKYFQELLKVGLPLIVLLAILLFADNFSTDTKAYSHQVLHNFIIIFLLVISLTIATVGCHRIFILGGSAVENSSLLYWSGNEVRYLGWWIFIGIFTLLTVLPLFLVLPKIVPPLEELFKSQPIYFALIGMVNIFIYYLVSRFSLVLPSSAIGNRNKTLKRSWELTSGNGWRVTLLIGLLPLIMGFIFTQLPTNNSPLISLILGVLLFIVGIIEIGLLSLSYKFLVTNEATYQAES